MIDYLGTEKFCKSCDDCKDMVCQNEKSDIKLENPTIIKED